MANYRELWFKNNTSITGWYTCQRCRKKIRKKDVDIDHIIPQSRGGRDVLDNLQCMCRTCNRSKQNDMGLHTVQDLGRNVVKNRAKGVVRGLFK